VSAFREYFEAGFGEQIIPIIPPCVDLSPMSTIKPGNLGKIPGRQNSSGSWGGYDWVNQPAFSQKDLAGFAKSGASLGLRCKNLWAVDIDIDGHKELALDFAEWVMGILGPSPVRYREDTDRLLLVYRTAFPAPTGKIVGKTPSGTAYGVDYLGYGRQFVAEGEHQDGAGPYLWTDDISPAAGGMAMLTEITQEQIDSIMGDK
jgi:hypothetical protein